MLDVKTVGFVLVCMKARSLAAVENTDGGA